MKKYRSNFWIGLVLVLTIMFLLIRGYLSFDEMQTDQQREKALAHVPRGVQGTLMISAYGESAKAIAPLRQRRIFINNGSHMVMEDNELRGFLDGFWKYRWNQTTQIHLRVGRRKYGPKYGELELKRLLLKWDGVVLPPGANIIKSQLTYVIEKGLEFPVDLRLYPVNKDWEPGQGGVKHNNISPPQTGEVWWGEVAAHQKPWGLPGAGFAHDEHPDADTPVMAIGETTYHPGDTLLQFESDALDSYIEQRLKEGKPLLFLLKLADVYEDFPGTVLVIYSGNYGDDLGSERRPYLMLEWDSPFEAFRFEKSISLEHGREVIHRLPDLGNYQWVVITFVPDIEFETPMIEVRYSLPNAQYSQWQEVLAPIAVVGNALEVKLRAVHNPLVLGDLFEAKIRNTWSPAGPPETQRLIWSFEDPMGREHTVDAKYLGDFHWSVQFQPSSVGRWRYWWTEHFTGAPHISAPGIFDVIGGDLENIRQQLIAFREHIATSGLRSPDKRYREYGMAFMKLEREVMRALTPERFDSELGKEVRILIREIRTDLSDNDVPDYLSPDLKKK